MKKKKWLSLLIVFLVAIFLLLPIVMTFIYSISRSWTDIVPKGITGEYYKELFTSTDFIMAVGRTLVLCIVPIGVMTVVILLALYNVLIYHPKLEKIFTNFMHDSICDSRSYSFCQYFISIYRSAAVFLKSYIYA